MTQPGFWDSPERAQKVVQEKKLCVNVVEPIDRLTQVIEDGFVLVELGEDDPASVDADLAAALVQLDEGMEALEFQLMLGGEHDASNAIVTLQSGAGGVDASDFAEMLLRMYVKWAGRHDYDVEELDFDGMRPPSTEDVAQLGHLLGRVLLVVLLAPF